MTSADEPEIDLVAYLYDELSSEERGRVERAIASSPELEAELNGLRRTLELVRTAPQPTATAGASDRLFAALDEALLEHPATAATIHSLDEYRSPLRRAWEFALYRYETSRAVRRAVSVSLVAHAAAACFLGWMLISEARQAPMKIEIAEFEPVDDGLRDESDSDDPLDELERHAGLDGDIPPSEADAWPSEFPQQADTGVPAWPRPRRSTAPSDEQLRFPTLPYMVRMRAVFDLDARRNKLERHAGELKDWVPTGIDAGLDWLARNRDADGTWGPSEDTASSLRTGVTAAVVLAFSSDGRSAAEGADEALLGPAVSHLEQELAADVDADLPLSTHALALRALTQQYGVAYRHLTGDERSARKALLRRSGDALLARQRDDGGFAADETLGETDASSTLLAATALIELRVAGVIDTKQALARAGSFLSGRRGDDGLLPAESGASEAALSAAMLSIADELSIESGLDATLDAVAAASEGEAGSLTTVWATTEALKRHRRPLVGTLARLRDLQAEGGAWPQVRELPEGGQALSTAVGVLSLTRLFVAN